MLARRHLALIVVWWATILSAAPHRVGGNSAGSSYRPAREGEGGTSSTRPWPVDIPIHLSSSFGEFRDGHIHAGLDIRSFGREGIPCRSVGSGYIARLRASPFGYGKAVYVKLADGETAVYAHLSEFAPGIDSVVWASQLESERYQVDIDLPPGRLPVEEGQIIAYTGRSGAAAPHLHFEMRDSGESPVNPLDIGWVLPDDDAPTIRRLKCLPLTPDARVNGRCAPVVVELRAVGVRTFAASETLTVNGAVGLGAQVIDRAGDSSGDLAPYRVELEVDQQWVSTIEMRRFTYDETPQVELVYDMASARTRGQHYLFLFRRKGETLAYRQFANDGIIRATTLPPGQKDVVRVHTAVVRATDYAGNVSTASLAFVVSTSPETVSAADVGATSRRTTGGRGELPGFYFFEDMMSVQGLVVADHDSVVAPGSRGGTPTSSVNDADEFVLTVGSVGESGRALAVRIGDEIRTVHVVAAPRDGALRRDFAEVGAGLTVKKGSLYSDALLYLASWERNVGETLPYGAGMRAMTAGVRFGPESAVLRKPVEIRLAAAGPPVTNAAVFRFDERRGVWSLRSSSARGDSICAPVREPGVYAVLVDSLAPTIGAPRLASRKSYSTGSIFPEVVVPVVDRGCGVDADRTDVYLDGKKQIARWDGFSEKVFVILRDKNIIGVHDLSIIAVDRLGNSTRLVTRLQIPPPSTEGGTGGSR